jgi:hypothetical protein
MQVTLNGTLVLSSGQKALISREADFSELLAYSSKELLFKAVEALKSLCAEFGEARSPVMDLYRQRLSQLRKHLQMA